MDGWIGQGMSSGGKGFGIGFQWGKMLGFFPGEERGGEIGRKRYVGIGVDGG